MTIWQAVIQGIIQGVTEFLPISSDGHLALFQHFFGLSQKNGLFFTVMLHLGTLIAVVAVYWKSILSLILSAVRWVQTRFTKEAPNKREQLDWHFIWMVILGTLPLVAFVFVKKFVEGLAQDNDIVVEGFCFLYTSALLFLASRPLRKRRPFAAMQPRQSLFLGLLQGLAILPGVSRSGSTISGGLLLGFEKESVVRYSFILGIPAILGASVFELKDALKSGEAIQWLPVLVGIVTAAAVGFFAIRFLQYLIRNDRLRVFAWYTLALGVVTIVIGLIEHLRGRPFVLQSLVHVFPSLF